MRKEVVCLTPGTKCGLTLGRYLLTKLDAALIESDIWDMYKPIPRLFVEVKIALNADKTVNSVALKWLYMKDIENEENWVNAMEDYPLSVDEIHIDALFHHCVVNLGIPYRSQDPDEIAKFFQFFLDHIQSLRKHYLILSEE